MRYPIDSIVGKVKQKTRVCHIRSRVRILEVVKKSVTHSTSSMSTEICQSLGLDTHPNLHPIHMLAPNTLHTSSTINANDLAIDPFAILRCKEGGYTGNIDWHADSVHG